MKAKFLDRLIERIDRIDPQSLQSFVLKLSREKGFLETLFNTIQEGIVVTDANGRIRYLNAAAGELLGLDLERAIGEPVTRALRDLDWEKIRAADKQEWSKVVANEIEVFYPRHRFLSFYFVPVTADRQDQMSGLAVILRDVTELRQRTETVIESEKLSALTLLAAGVAHEIGNPLNSLNIHLQLIERELKRLPAPQAKRLREDVRVARDEIGRLDGIISQFLKAVRPTTPALKRVGINEVVTETLALLHNELANRDVLVEQELGANLPATLLDTAQMKQAFFNVVKNALEAMRAGGILRIRTEAEAAHLVVSFIDTGAGIAPEQIGRIFEPYQTTKKTGSGLGLMIVQRIVREHGGTIEIASSVGRGTTFRIRLPISEQRTRLLSAANPHSRETRS